MFNYNPLSQAPWNDPSKLILTHCDTIAALTSPMTQKLPLYFFRLELERLAANSRFSNYYSRLTPDRIL